MVEKVEKVDDGVVEGESMSRGKQAKSRPCCYVFAAKGQMAF